MSSVTFAGPWLIGCSLMASPLRSAAVRRALATAVRSDPYADQRRAARPACASLCVLLRALRAARRQWFGSEAVEEVQVVAFEKLLGFDVEAK